MNGRTQRTQLGQIHKAVNAGHTTVYLSPPPASSARRRSIGPITPRSSAIVPHSHARRAEPDVPRPRDMKPSIAAGDAAVAPRSQPESFRLFSSQSFHGPEGDAVISLPALCLSTCRLEAVHQGADVCLLRSSQIATTSTSKLIVAGLKRSRLNDG